MTKKELLLKSLELAHEKIEELQTIIDEFSSDYADLQNDLLETNKKLKTLTRLKDLAEIKRKLQEPIQ
tara:strand:- start:2288 stop:2491 length:204 start_codon:yes stop_codon:yes gene_type:complete